MTERKPIPTPTAGGSYVHEDGKLSQIEPPTKPAMGKTARKAAEAKARADAAKAARNTGKA